MSNVLLGACIGDALGKFAESKLPNYQPLLDWDGKTFLPSEHHGLLANAYTDDGQFSVCVAQSLIDNNGFNPEDLAKRYVELFTSNTIRGYGRTTLAAVQNLIAGKKYYESGIDGSFGNGGAMRCSPFSIWFRDDITSLIEAVTIDTQITHASDEAIAGSLAIALAAAYDIKDTDDLLDKVYPHLPDSKVKQNIFGSIALINAWREISPEAALGFIGTRADIRMTAPAALYCYLRFNNYQEAVVTAIRAGGDTDTTGSIVEALFGAKLGIQGIPSYWVEQIENRDQLINLDSQLYNQSGQSLFPRN